MRNTIILTLALFISTICVGQINMQDSLALVALYNHTNGNEWNNCQICWFTNPVSDWNGIQLEDERVVGINLSIAPVGGMYCGLDGDLPSEIWQMNSLRGLVLNGNSELIGQIPTTIGYMESLRFLEISDCNYFGILPAQITELPSLRSLQLSNNCFDSDIPSGILAMDSLLFLKLNGNDFHGPIPDEISETSQLIVLDLGNNDFIGSFPEGITELPGLEQLDISHNRFDFIPNLALCSQLKTADVSYNNLEFDCLEPNMSLVGIDEFVYSPQDSVNAAMDTIVKKNMPFEIIASVGGSANEYQWYHNDESIEGATDSIISISNVELADRGKYTCAITNSLVPDLTLWRRSVNLYVDTTNSITSLTQHDLLINIDNQMLTICGVTAGLEMQIMDIQGKVLLSKSILPKQETYISMNGLPKSVLILRFSNSESSFSKRIINQ